jgi:tripartite ATP-independent transporter DctP family solute receptor
LLFVLGCGRGSGDKVLLRLAHGLSEKYTVHLAMVRFAEIVEEKSNGAMTVKIYPNAQLGPERELLELLQMGAIDLAKSNASPMESFVRDYAVLSLPYIFKDYQHFLRVLESPVGERILNSTEQHGFIGVAYYTAGTRSFYAKKPILIPDDLKGLKVRVQMSPTTIKLVESLGGQATPLAYGELYTALQQGVVDAAENNIPSFVNDRHSEVSKHYSFDEHAMPPDVFLISTKTWKRLNQEQREIIKAAAFESYKYQLTLWDAADQIAMDEAKAMGVTFHNPDKAPFREKTKAMIDAARADAVLGSYVEGIEKVD